MMNEKETNDRKMNLAENFVIISSRKIDFLTKFIEKLKSENKKKITPDFISEAVHIVASLDPLLFISQKELRDGHLYLETSLEKLDREKIGKEIAEQISDIVK